jgi:hypothetical protein
MTAMYAPGASVLIPKAAMTVATYAGARGPTRSAGVGKRARTPVATSAHIDANSTNDAAMVTIVSPRFVRSAITATSMK